MEAANDQSSVSTAPHESETSKEEAKVMKKKRSKLCKKALHTLDNAVAMLVKYKDVVLLQVIHAKVNFDFLSWLECG